MKRGGARKPHKNTAQSQSKTISSEGESLKRKKTVSFDLSLNDVLVFQTTESPEKVGNRVRTNKTLKNEASTLSEIQVKESSEALDIRDAGNWNVERKENTGALEDTSTLRRPKKKKKRNRKKKKAIIFNDLGGSLTDGKVSEVSLEITYMGSSAHIWKFRLAKPRSRTC